MTTILELIEKAKKLRAQRDETLMMLGGLNTLIAEYERQITELAEQQRNGALTAPVTQN